MLFGQLVGGWWVDWGGVEIFVWVLSVGGCFSNGFNW